MRVMRNAHDGVRPSKRAIEAIWAELEVVAGMESDNLRLSRPNRHDAFGRRRQPRTVEFVRGVRAKGKRMHKRYQPKVTPHVATIARDATLEGMTFRIDLWGTASEPMRRLERAETADIVRGWAKGNASHWNAEWRLEATRGQQTLTLTTKDRATWMDGMQRLEALRRELTKRTSPRRLRVPKGTNTACFLQ